MKKTLTASVLALALTGATVTAPLAQGREANMSEQQVANAMVSTSGSLVANPSSGPASSAAGSLTPMPVLLVLTAVIVLAAVHGGNVYLPSY